MQFRPVNPFTRSLGTILPPAILLACCATLHGEGLRSPTLGAAGLGESGGRHVFIDDASAAFHMPANLAEFHQWEASVEPTVAYHRATFESANGTVETRHPVKFLPNFFAGGPVVTDTLFLGLAVTTPYGLGIDWQKPPSVAQPFYGDLKSLDVSPTLAFRLFPTFRVAFGLDAMWSSVKLRQNFAIPGTEFEAKGDGVGYGANFSASWDFLPYQRITASLHTPVDVTYRGDAYITGGGSTLATFNNASTQIAFPAIVTLGYGIDLPHGVKIEANGEWLQFSRFQSLAINVPGLPLPAVPEQWNDTFTAGLGASWRCCEHWVLRGSYQYFETPVPDSTYSPVIPDSDQHALTIGIGARYGRHRFDLAYGHVFYLDRTLPQYAGTFKVDAHLMSAAYGISF
ncbi:MAG TPA: outer membrane protein transport protein [Candidatus Limnocylindria bacterium]|jgi:long-chain fatty acid transport protein|nr:outer membrane protein transport protein [Candidatus Limnocylindria bacterium]